MINQVWVFTFGCGQRHAGKYVEISGSYSEARKKMFELFGDKWAFQYSKEEFEQNRARGVSHETKLEVIE